MWTPRLQTPSLSLLYNPSLAFPILDPQGWPVQASLSSFQLSSAMGVSQVLCRRGELSDLGDFIFLALFLWSDCRFPGSPACMTHFLQVAKTTAFTLLSRLVHFFYDQPSGTVLSLMLSLYAGYTFLNRAFLKTSSNHPNFSGPSVSRQNCLIQHGRAPHTSSLPGCLFYCQPVNSFCCQNSSCVISLWTSDTDSVP